MQCFTTQIDDQKWLQEISRLKNELKTFGVDDVKIGMELEFSPQYGEPNTFALARKKEFVSELEKELSRSGDGTQQAQLRDKLDQLRTFGPPELMMYDLIEKTPETNAILEHSFGKGLQGEGYYDNAGIIEARLKYVAPEELCRNRKIFLNALAQKMKQYGIAYENPRQHISYSFYKGSNNLMNAESDEHNDSGAHIIEGVSRAMYDGAAVIRDPRHNLPIQHIATGIARTNFIRLANGRLEERLPADDPEYQHPEALITLTLAGALYGLRAHEIGHEKQLESIIAARPIERIVFKQREPGYAKVLHLLTTAKRDNPQKAFEVDTSYLKYALPNICVQLGLVEDNSKQFKELIHLSARSGVLGTNSPTYQRYTKQVTEIISKFLSDPSDPALNKLRNALEPMEVLKTVEIAPGYHFVRQTPGVAVSRLKESNLMQNSISPDLYQDLCANAEAELGKPGVLDKATVNALNLDITRTVRKARRDAIPALDESTLNMHNTGKSVPFRA